MHMKVLCYSLRVGLRLGLVHNTGEREREREGGGGVCVCTQPFHPSLCRPARESTSVSKIFRKILVCEVSPFESKQYAL